MRIVIEVPDVDYPVKSLKTGINTLLRNLKVTAATREEGSETINVTVTLRPAFGRCLGCHRVCRLRLDNGLPVRHQCVGRMI